jgi:hypothetical protein
MMILQPRDRHLLTELEVLRVIDREQAKFVAGFHSTTRANTRLLKLTQAGLLRRFFLGSEGAGRKALYALSEKGADLVGVRLRGPRRRQDASLVADYFIEHQLTINRIYCALKYRPLPGMTFHRWQAFHEPITAGLRLIPDGYVELESPSGRISAFLEVDLGHENLKVWQEKVRNYLQLAISGTYPNRFRVLVLANSERRAQSLRKCVAAMTGKIFWFRNLESSDRDGFFAPLWQRPRDDTRRPFETNGEIAGRTKSETGNETNTTTENTL